MEFPIFIISFNRISVLDRSIKSYLKLTGIGYGDIHIIDMGSTYQPLLDYYDALKIKGVDVIACAPLSGGPPGLNIISDVIEQYKQGRSFDYYAVTDPDISLELAQPDALDVYVNFLKNFPNIEIVGPMLKIVDIPADYPAREWCWKRHADQFWHKVPETFEHHEKKAHYQFAEIDTTFGVLRSTSKYRRRLQGIRVYHPYEALHLDWYITEANITGDQINYLKTSNPGIAHWGSSWYQAPPKETLVDAERDIYIVQGSRSGQAAVRKVRLGSEAANPRKRGIFGWFRPRERD